MDRRIAWHSVPVNISTQYGQALGQCHIIGPLPLQNRRNRRAIQLGE